MALPGVKTVLRDQFYTLTRSEVPEDVKRIAVIARRDASTDTDDTNYPNYDPVVMTSESEVIAAFGEGSELHRGFLEVVAGGGARIVLIPVASTVTDADYESTADGNPFDAAFEAVEAARVDIVVPWGRGSHPTEWQDPATPADDPAGVGFHADNSAAAGTSLALRVARACKEITDRTYPVFAIMGLRPYVGTGESMTPGDVVTHYGSGGLPGLLALEDMEPYGGYVSVVANDVVPVGYNRDEWGYSNGAGAYAGFVSSLPAEEAPTGKRLFNVSAVRSNLPRPVQEDLIDQGVVPIATGRDYTARVIDGITFAVPTSDFVRLSTLRTVFGTVELVRKACEPFIGKPAKLQYQASLETAVTARLRALQVAGVLLSADFSIAYKPNENKAVIDLVLQPAFEIRNIEISVAVQI